jgi:hypothetical protein
MVYFVVYPQICSTDVNRFICNMGRKTFLSAWRLVRMGVEPLFQVGEPVFQVLEPLGHLLHVSEDLSLHLSSPVEGIGRLAYALGLLPEPLGYLPGVFVLPPHDFAR